MKYLLIYFIILIKTYSGEIDNNENVGIIWPEDSFSHVAARKALPYLPVSESKIIKFNRLNPKNCQSAVFHIETRSKKDFVLRVIDPLSTIKTRQTEINISVLTGEKNIAPKVVYADADDCAFYILPFIKSGRVTEQDFKNESLVLLAASLLKEVHEIPEKINTSTKSLSEIVFYLTDTLYRNKLPTPKILKQVLWEARLLLNIFFHDASDIVLCHGDLHPNNFLFSNGHLKLIDWETCNMDNRYFELAQFSIAVFSSNLLEDMFLHHYFSGEYESFKKLKFQIAKILMDLYDSICLLASPFIESNPPFNLKNSIENYYSEPYLEYIFYNSKVDITKHTSRKTHSNLLNQKKGVLKIRNFYKYMMLSRFSVAFKEGITKKMIDHNIFLEKRWPLHMTLVHK